jgi:hypothetical protein
MAREPKPPAESGRGSEDLPAHQSSRAEIDAFLGALRDMPASPRTGTGPAGRLIFAMDATMSRKPTWEMALTLQSGMFQAVQEIGGLDVQLVFFRGFYECRASRWVSDAGALAKLMQSVDCLGGQTQIGRVLAHAAEETKAAKVNALVYVGDAMEEDIDRLAGLAGELGLLRVPVFLFQEGYNQAASRTFREIARLTGGAHCRFGAGSASELRELLRAVAVYATGGRAALENYAKGRNGPGLLLEQLSKPPNRA